MSSFCDLPIELLSSIIKNTYQQHESDDQQQELQIRKQLCRYALVNTQFYAAVNPLIWSSPTLGSNAQANKFLTGVTKSAHATGHHVRVLCYDFIRSDQILLQLIPHLCFLTRLEIVDAKHITDTSIRQLPHHCPYLTSLWLRFSHISNHSIYVLAELCQQLTLLHLYDCPGLTSDVFSALAGCASSLTNLTITVATSTKADWITPDETTTMVRAATRLDQLMHFSLQGAPLCFVDRLVSVLGTTTTVWPHLTVLALDGHGGTIGDAQLVPLIRSHRGLVDFSFVGGKLTDTTLEAIATFLPGIQSVAVERNQAITSRGVRRLVRRCLRLAWIALYGCGLAAYHFPEVVRDGRYYEMDEEVDELDNAVMDKIRLCVNSDPGESPDEDEDDEEGDDSDREVDYEHEVFYDEYLYGPPDYDYF